MAPPVLDRHQGHRKNYGPIRSLEEVAVGVHHVGIIEACIGDMPHKIIVPVVHRARVPEGGDHLRRRAKFRLPADRPLRDRQRVHARHR